MSVGHVTKILAGEQVEYRLKEGAGCCPERDGPQRSEKPAHDHSGDGDVQVAYRLAAGEELPLVWLGEGLRAFGITPGSVMTDGQKDWARALMNGAHPRTGEQLVDPVMRTAPAGKLPTAPLVAAIEAAAQARGVAPAALVKGYGPAEKRLASAARMVAKQGEAHRISFKDAAMLAEVARVDLAQVYGAAAVGGAAANAGERVRVGTRGYDLTIGLSKSHSVLYGLAGGRLRGELDAAIAAGVDRMLAQVTGDVVYGMAGHHGDGQRAERVRTGGMIGWRMDHRTARPVDGKAPDPHAHVHIMFANMALGEDGAWRTIAAGGRDLMRHARLADELVKHEIRGVLLRRGARYERDAVTGEWELAAIPRALREQFSKRSVQAAEELAKMGVGVDEATAAQRRMANARSRQGKGSAGGAELDREWAAQARAAGFEPHAVLAAALPGWPDAGPLGDPHGPGPGPGPLPDLGALAAAVFDPERGLTAHRKVITRVDVLAQVTAFLQGGQSIGQITALTDALLGSEHAVRLPEREIRHLSNAARYTTADIVAAETSIIESARARFFGNAAALPAADAEMALSAVEAGLGFELAAEQRAFVMRTLTRGYGIDALVGTAGAGKTVLTSAIRAAYEAHGMTVRGATLAAVAGAHLQSESGIPTMTIAGWVQQIRGGSGLRGVDVLVIDEAAMADDRQLAVIVEEAERTGTKLVMTGDHLQLKSPGVGGAFKAVHELVGGLELRDNRRQVDQAEREALAKWRGGKRREVLTDLAGMGRVHVAESAADAYAQILARYRALHERYPDPHERIARLVVLAGTNEAADRLNAGIRAVLRADGLLPQQERGYRLAYGGRAAFAVGDQVMLRTNDYRTRKDPSSNDVLNGYRGIVRAIDERGNIHVEWMKATADGPVRAAEWITPGYIARGGLSHAYALTVHKSQGLTVDQALVYGAGLDAHTLYPALTRARQRTDLVLPRLLIESPERQLELGEPATAAEALARAVQALADQIEGDRPDDVVIRELGALIKPIHPAPAPETAAREPALPVDLEAQSAAMVAALAVGGVSAEDRQGAGQPEEPADPVWAEEQDVEQDVDVAVDVEGDGDRGVPVWHERPAGRYTDARLAQILERHEAQQVAAREVEDFRRAVQGDDGPAVRALREGAPQVQEHGRLAAEGDAAREAWHKHRTEAERLGRVRAGLERELGALEGRRGPGLLFTRAARRGLRERIETAAARQSAAADLAAAARTRYESYRAALGPEYDERGAGRWGQMQTLAKAHRRNWPAVLEQARSQDRTRLFYLEHRTLHTDPLDAGTLAQIRQEVEARAAMPPAARQGEERARAQYHAQRQAAADARPPAPRQPTASYRPPPTNQPGRGHGR